MSSQSGLVCSSFWEETLRKQSLQITARTHTHTLHSEAALSFSCWTTGSSDAAWNASERDGRGETNHSDEAEKHEKEGRGEAAHPAVDSKGGGRAKAARSRCRVPGCVVRCDREGLAWLPWGTCSVKGFKRRRRQNISHINKKFKEKQKRLNSFLLK